MGSHTILVRNIPDFELFIAHIQQNAADVRSLSIVIEPVALTELCGETDDPLGASESTRQLWQLLEELGSALPFLGRLQIFSLQVMSGRNRFWIPRPLLSTLLSKLPVNCTSVEIDTFGSDRAKPGTSHLCETIRNTLPKLEHLRLNLSTLCAKAWQVEVQCPKLLTFTISCFAGGYYNSRLCGSYVEDPVHSSFAQGKEAMPHLVHQVRSVVHFFPNITQAIICDQSGSSDSSSAFHLTYNLRDVLRDRVTAMPMEYVYPFADDGDGYMLRTPEGDVFGSRPALKAVLEAGIREEHGKARALPQDLEKPQQLLSLDEWSAKYPRRSCRLWLNEKREGKRLVDACVILGAASRVRLPIVPEFEGQVLRDYDAGY